MASSDNNDDFEEPPEQWEVDCDGCHDNYSGELVQCPASSEEIRPGIVDYPNYCEDCCEDAFDLGVCQMHVGNCDRATQLMVKKIKKMADSKNFKTFRNERVFIDNNQFFCIADNDTSIEDFFKDTLEIIPSDKIDLFEGRETVIVKTNDKQIYFSLDIYNELLSTFSELKCHKDSFGFLTTKQILVVQTEGMWGAIGAKTEDLWFSDERHNFLEKMKHGYRFFNVGKKDGVILIESAEIPFNWPKLTDSDFVRLCRDIYASLPNVEEATITDGPSDLGQDISVIENVSSLTGVRKRKWAIQCKHYPSRKVAPSDIPEVLNSSVQLKFDVFCLMSSNLLLPGCQRLLQDIKESPAAHFDVVSWDRDKIEDFLRNNPDLYTRYFVK